MHARRPAGATTALHNNQQDRRNRIPLASDYWHEFRVRLDDVFVYHDKRRGRTKTLRVGFPDRMDEHLAHGDELGLCAGDAPL
jgi:hypothetical protein